MKALKSLAALMFTAASLMQAAAQTGYTTVTGSLAAFCYNNGSIQAAWQNGNPSAPVLPTLNGVPFAQYVPTGIDSDGNFTITLADTHIVQPNSPNFSSWKVTACAKGGSQPACYSATIPVTGATMNVSSYFAAATSACVGNTTEVNSVPLIKQSPVNFIDSPSVGFTNPALGNVTATVKTTTQTPAIVGTNCNASTSSGSFTTATVTLNCTGLVAGNSLLLTGYADQVLNAFFGVAMSVSDSQGNTWTQDRHHYGFQFEVSGSLWHATNIQAGSDTIQVTYNATNAAGNIAVLYGSADQISGLNTVYPVVQSSEYQTLSGATSAAFPGMTPTQTGDLLYNTNLQQGNTGLTYSSSGYTALSAHCPTGLCNGALYALSTAATPSLWTPTVSWSAPQGGSGMGFMVEFAAGGNPNPVLQQYPPAGIPRATGSATTPWTTSFGVQGTDTNVPTSGNMTGSTGTALCKDANGGVSTVGCTGGGVTSASATSPLRVNAGAGPASGAITLDCPTCATSSSGTNYTWTFTSCANNVGQPTQCLGTTTLPGAMPNSTYFVHCDVFPNTEPSDQFVLISTWPLPTSAGGTLSYRMVQPMQNGTAGGVTMPIVCMAHHD